MKQSKRTGERKGASPLEYLLLASLVAIVTVFAVTFAGVSVNEPFSEISSALDSGAEEIQAAPTAAVEIDQPSSLEMGQTGVVEISIDTSAVSVQPANDGTVGEPSGASTQRVPVTLKMSADLIGNGFEVVGISPSEQIVISGDATEWSWQVTPQNEQASRLDWSLRAFLSVGDGATPRVVETGYITIGVQSELGELVKRFGIPLLMLLVGIPGAIVAIKVVRGRSGKGSTAARIFISYRRGDSAGHTGRLNATLAERFGHEVVFRDIEDLAPGADFETELESALSQSKAMLVVIGRTWATASDNGERRLFQEGDFVRREAAAGLGRSDVLVIPVLVDGSNLPSAEELPEDLQSLRAKQTIEISDERWDYDVQRLGDALAVHLDL